MTRIRIGTRASQLALWQANWVMTAFKERGMDSEIVEISTSGDRIQHDAIADIGAQGVFTKEIQRALFENKVDLAVHSLKDLPTEPVEGLTLAATPERGPFRDVVVSRGTRGAKTVDELPRGAVIGTGSSRRKAQLKHRFGEKYEIRDIRGNVETRLKKLDAGDYDAIILAEAGLVRLKFSDRITSFLEPPGFLPAVGQGILGIECRVDDVRSREMVALINDPATFAAATAERSLLKTLRGGCLAPIAALANHDQDHDQTGLTLHARVLSPDGTQMLETRRSGSLAKSEELGITTAHELLRLGAKELLRNF